MGRRSSADAKWLQQVRCPAPHTVLLEGLYTSCAARLWQLLAVLVRC